MKKTGLTPGRDRHQVGALSVETMKDQVEEVHEKLTTWELGFLEGIEDKLAAGDELTVDQAAKLEQIWRQRVLGEER